MKKIAILFGGRSGEHEVSLASAAAVLSALDRTKYEPLAIGITKDGAWRLTDASPAEIARGAWEAGGLPCMLSSDPTRPGLWLADGRCIPLDLIFSLCHGGAGEDGRMAGLFSLSGIPFVGSPCEGAALAMNKAIAKRLAHAAGVPILPHFITNGRDPDGAKAKAAALGYPLFVKPLRGGSSVGAGVVEREGALADAVLCATADGDDAIVEPYLPAREIEVAILEEGGRLSVSPVGEIAYSGGFYDYDTKYEAGRAALFLASLTPLQNTRVREYAKKVFRTLGLRHYARVDFFLSGAGEIYFNEVNTLPGFTAGSMYPFLLAGGDLGALCDRLLRAALP